MGVIYVSKKSKKLRKRIKRSQNQRYMDPYITNCHHCLWIGKKWNAGHYSRMLRNYWYFKVYIPANTIHKLIHQEMVEIPVPSEDVCRMVYYDILAMENRGEITPEDPIWERLQLLIDQIGDNCPTTTYALSKQVQILKEFYARAVK